VRIPVDLPPGGSRPFDVVGVGLNTTDLLAVLAAHPVSGTKQEIRRFEACPGGQAATAMTACRRLGWAARYVGRFGDDAHGADGRASLTDAGVDISACETVAGATNAVSLVLVDETTGQRTVLFSRHPGLRMTPADIPGDAVRSGRVLLVDCHATAAATTAAQLARQVGIPTVIDVEKVRPGIEALLAEIDIIITAEEFPSAHTGVPALGGALRALAERYRPALVCATLGERGSLGLVGGREVRTPPFRVPVVDTTGAGDAFRGGFISGWLAGGGETDCGDVLRYANAVAALKCRRLGARDGLPTRAEVERLLQGSAI
jgi:sulfofructose kinase